MCIENTAKNYVTENLKKGKGFHFFSALNLLWDLYGLTIGSDLGTLKMVRADVCCSVSRF